MRRINLPLTLLFSILATGCPALGGMGGERGLDAARAEADLDTGDEELEEEEDCDEDDEDDEDEDDEDDEDDDEDGDEDEEDDEDDDC